jgi:Tfp pilus assembly protein PilV
MADSSRGIALVEIVVAMMLLAVGLLSAAAALTASERALWRARARSEGALLLANRVATLQTLARGDPRCEALQSGTAGTSPGAVESWDVWDEGALRRVRLRVRITGPGELADSVEMAVRCE